MAIFNNSEFTPVEVLAMPVLGYVVNERMKRTVNLHRHPSDGKKVVTVGTTWDGFATLISVEPMDWWREHVTVKTTRIIANAQPETWAELAS